MKIKEVGSISCLEENLNRKSLQELLEESQYLGRRFVIEHGTITRQENILAADDQSEQG